MTRHATITTYGVLHGTAPASTPTAAVILDLTTALRNPHHDPAMRYLTGLDDAVRDHVLTTPGAEQIITDTAERITTALANTEPGTPVHAQVYCQGGRHRSVAVAEQLGARLRGAGITVHVHHRDVDKPVVQK